MIHITWGNLIPPRCSQANIVNSLLAPSFFNNPDLGKTIQESSFYQRKDGTILDALNSETNKAFRSRLFNFGDSPKTSEKLINLLLLKTQQDNIAYTLDTFPIRHEFKKQWKIFLREYFGDRYSIYLEDYKKYINLFIEDNYTIEDFEAEADTDLFKREDFDRRNFQKSKITIPYHGNNVPLSKLLYSIEAADYSKSPFLDERNSSDISHEDNLFFERLSTLSILACVWVIFTKVEEKENKQTTSGRKDKKNVYAELIVRLSQMIFPTETVNTIFFTTPENDGSDSIVATFEIPSEKNDTAEARKMLAPVPGYINAKAFTEAGEICEQVFQSYKYASDPVMAETLTYLHTCCINGYPVPKAFSSIEDIEKQAYYYGSIYSSQKRNDIKAAPVPSKAVTSGFFTANCKNKIYDWIEKTKPESWKSSVSSVPESAILPHVHQRILLIHNDFNINLQDALNILDRIKKNISTEKETTISDWKNFELYIRCNEEEATPVLDTALSYFTENNEIRSSADFSLIKIYLIDEAKRSADTFDITMAVFDMAQHIVSGAAGVIGGDTNIDVTEALAAMQEGLKDMEIPELLLLVMETSLVSLCMKIMSVLITVILYGRMIEIYAYCSVSPIPFATMTNREWGQIGNNYLKGLFALGFQGFLIMICVGIYAVLVGEMVVADNLHSAIFSLAAYTVILCFSLFKSGALAKSIFNAH